MKVKDMKEMLKGKDDETDLVFLSSSGTAWEINNSLQENPKVTKSNDGKSEQVVIFIK